TVFILIAGAYYVTIGELSYGDFAAFILISNVLFKPLEKINAVIELYPNGIAGFKHFLDTMSEKADITEKENAIELKNVKGNITYDKVSFAYDEKDVLTDISFNIKAGDTIAFFYHSFSFKTKLKKIFTSV